MTIWESGCFNVSKTVYQRIPSLNAADPEVGAYKYEDNPTTLEGTWHLAKANFSFGGIYEFEPGDVIVYFNPNHTVQVINKSETKERKPFMDSGFYSYEIIKTETNKYDGMVFTTIDLNGDTRLRHGIRCPRLFLQETEIHKLIGNTYDKENTHLICRSFDSKPYNGMQQ